MRLGFQVRSKPELQNSYSTSVNYSIAFSTIGAKIDLSPEAHHLLPQVGCLLRARHREVPEEKVCDSFVVPYLQGEKTLNGLRLQHTIGAHSVYMGIEPLLFRVVWSLRRRFLILGCRIGVEGLGFRV